MKYIVLPTDYVTNFKRNCKSKYVSDSGILSLFGNIEMVNSDNVGDLVEMIKKYRPNVYNYIK